MKWTTKAQKLGALSLAAMLALAAPAHAAVMESFESEIPVADSELSGMRGGFITAGGLTIDFGLTTQTIINGAVASETIISSVNANQAATQDLVKLIQVGDKNSAQLAALQQQLSEVPGLLTVIQNTLDGTTIQQFNILDIQVTNVDSFRDQLLTPMTNFQTVFSLR